MKNHNPNLTRNLNTCAATADSTPPLVIKAARLADAGQCEDALRMLSRCNSAAYEVLNARAVCLMRLGRIDEAVRLFRSFLMHTGCTWIKPEMPVIYRANFATALLLAGLPAGARDTLYDIDEKDHASVIRLQEALDKWRKNLTWWRKFNWMCGMAPAVPIAVDFVPGEFVDPMAATVLTPPPAPSASQPTTQQVA